MMVCLRPGGKLLASSSIFACTACAAASAFDPGRWKMPMPVAGSRSR